MNEYTGLLDRMSLLIFNDLKYATNNENWVVSYEIDISDFQFITTVQLESGDKYSVKSRAYDIITFSQISVFKLVKQISSEALGLFNKHLDTIQGENNV